MPKGVIFIPGRNQSFNSFRFVVEPIQKMVPIVSISISDFNNLIIEKPDSKIDWVIVAHSLGVVPALLLKSLKIKGLCLIDPTPLDQEYLEKILERKWFNLADQINQINIKAEKYPVHLHFDPDKNLTRKIQYYKKLVQTHQISKMIIYPDAGHMIHLKHPDKIIQSIRELLK